MGSRERSAMSRVAFRVGDLLLLVAIGIEAAVGMQVAHALVPGAIASTAVGMVGGMAAGVATSFLVRPLLGSIESAVPTMIGGMAAGLSVCLVMLTAGPVTTAVAIALGITSGAALFLMLLAFAGVCRRRFERVA